MKIGKATFTALRGCIVEIDGWQADIETKQAMLADGVCNVRALDLQDQPKADSLMTAVAGDGQTPGCDNLQLLELAAHYYEWSNGGKLESWKDMVFDPLPEKEAAASFGVRLARILNPEG
jgi:hypothetical protein